MPMMWKPILILLLSVITSDPQTPQLKMPGERQPDALPRDLTETETQKILREDTPRPRVDATLKASDLRLASTLKFVEENQYKSAAQDVDVYAALIVYADAYTRKLPPSQIKDRNDCLKKIEQAKKIRLRAVNDLLGGGRVIKTSDE